MIIADALHKFIEHLLIGQRHCADGVKRRKRDALFVITQIDVTHRDEFLFLRERTLNAKMTIDDIPGSFVHDHALNPTNLVEHAIHRNLLRLGMTPEVQRVGDQLRWVDARLADDARRPARLRPRL